MELTALAEEGAELGSALIGQHAWHEGRMMVELGFGKQVNYTAAGTRLGVGSTINHPPQPGVHDSASAHYAGFERHVELASHQPVIADPGCSIPHRNNLGMGGGVMH